MGNAARLFVVDMICEAREGCGCEWIDENHVSVAPYTDVIGDYHSGLGINFGNAFGDSDEFTTIGFYTKFAMQQPASLHFINDLNLKQRFVRWFLDDGLTATCEIYCPNQMAARALIIPVYSVFDGSLRIIRDMASSKSD